MFTKKALEKQHERDKIVIEELDDVIEDRNLHIEELEKKVYSLRKWRGVIPIQKAYMDKEILDAVRKIQGRHVTAKFLTLIEKILDWLHERF